ncbi:MAG: DUF2927 domain-containing protein [Paracoccus sp. (in: a-proteobacteria)]|uniref:DUF2927 domain-containing protein n=1 Tax=Paracoccus sp. TaxID=267 RepID=UPI0039E5F3F5
MTALAFPSSRPTAPLLALACIALLAGCDGAPKVDSAPPEEVIGAAAPRPRPSDIRQAALRRDRAASAREARLAAQTAADTPASRQMRAYLQGVEKSLIGRGLMRTDGGTEIAMTPERLADDFVLVALHDEYTRQNGELIANSIPAPLRRWVNPVRMRIEFGASVAPAQRSRDRADIAAYAARLQAATGHPVSLGAGDGNFTILILSEDERHDMAERLAALVPGIPPSDVNALVHLSPQNYCTVFAYSRGSASTYAHAVALIRSETPQRLRLSCVHEELAQGMGLANDSRLVRPSIFNDDEEFASLTPHDELLLKILYDPRLHPGMTEAESRPIVLQIARELLAAQS